MLEPESSKTACDDAVSSNSTKQSSIDNFSDLIRALDAECQDIPIAECQAAFGHVMERVCLPNSEWGPYALMDENKLYTRNLIHSNDHYALMVLCWNPEKESPIHDHPCDGCWLKVVQGCIAETRYVKDEATDSLVEVSCNQFEAGSLGFMHDKIGLHKITNPSGDVTITLHLYSPPFRACKIWTKPSCASQYLCPSVCYYSVKGVRVQDGLTTNSTPDLASWGHQEEKKYEEEKSREVQCV